MGRWHKPRQIIYSSENNLNKLILFTLCGTPGSKAGHIWQQGPHPLTRCEDPRKFPIPSNKYTTREQVLGGDMNSRGSLGSVWSRSECVLTWEPYQGRPQLQVHGNKWQAPHTHIHTCSEAQRMAMCGPCVDVIHSICRKMSKIPHLQPEDCSLTKIS